MSLPHIFKSNAAIVLLSGLATTMLVFALGSFVINKLGDLGQIRQEEQYLERIDLLGNDIRARLSSLSTITLLTAEYLAVSPASNRIQAVAPIYRRIKQLFPNLRTVVVVNPDGLIIEDMRDNKPGVGINVADREYFAIHLGQGIPENFQVFSPVVSRVDGKWTWVMSAAVRDQANNLIAVVVTSVDRRFFNDIFLSLDYINNSFGLMANVDGYILEASPRRKYLVGQLIDDFPATQAADTETIHRNFIWPDSGESGTLLQKQLKDWPIQLSFFLNATNIWQARQESIGTLRYWIGILLLAIIASTLLLAANVRKQERSTQQIRQQERKLGKLLETTGSGILSVDNSGSCISCNAAAIHALGYESVNEILGSDLDGILQGNRHQDNAQKKKWNPIAQVFRSRKAYVSNQEYLFRKNGEKFPVQLHINPVTDGCNQISARLS